MIPPCLHSLRQASVFYDKEGRGDEERESAKSAYVFSLLTGGRGGTESLVLG